MVAATSHGSAARPNASPSESRSNNSAELVLSTETIRTHVRNAMRKLGTRTRAHAIVVAVRQGELAL